MISVEEELIDRITATLHHLRTGKVPPAIPVPDDLPNNEIRQLINFVNRFLVEFAILTETMEQIAQGELKTRPMTSKTRISDYLSPCLGRSFNKLHEKGGSPVCDFT